jgi:hypothetical protein
VPFVYYRALLQGLHRVPAGLQVSGQAQYTDGVPLPWRLPAMMHMCLICSDCTRGMFSHRRCQARRSTRMMCLCLPWLSTAVL